MAMVFIWNNHMLSSKFLGRDPAHKYEYPGHASMQIKQVFNTGFYRSTPPLTLDTMTFHAWFKEDPYFVSWMPWTTPGGHAMKKQNGETHRGGGMMANFLFDLVAEGYAPDHVIHIKATAAQVTRMSAKRTEIINKYGAGRSPSYRLYRKNCSTVVARVLRAAYGGTHFKVKSFFHKLIPWTPLEIKRVCQNLPGSSAYTWDDFLLELKDNMYIHTNAYICLKEFMKRSSIHGSSGAKSRHTYEDGSKHSLKHRRKLSSKAANTVDFVAQQARADLNNIFQGRRMGREAKELSVETGGGLLDAALPVK